MSKDDKSYSSLPKVAVDYIKMVVKSMRYRRKVRNEVRSELIEHFIDALKKCTSDKETAATELITEFGDPKLLGIMIRRGKKRCRPLWRKVISVTLRSFLAVVVLFVFYMLWFINGKPNPDTNYLAKLNDSIKPAIIDGDNAWANYERAIDLYVEPDEQVTEILSIIKKAESGSTAFTQLSEDERLVVRKWVEANDKAWDQYNRASEKSYCYRAFASEGSEVGMLINVTLPHLSTFRKISMDAGLWRIRIAMADGNIESALNDCLVMLRVGKHWQGKGVLIEQLVGIAINDLGLKQILEIIDSDLMTKENLLEVKRSVAQVYSDGYPLIDVSSEKLFFLDTVQYTFTDNGPGGGHLIPKNIPPLVDIDGSGSDYEYPWSIVGAGLLHAGRDETVQTGLEIYGKLESIGVLTPYQREQQGISDSNVYSELSPVKNRFLMVFLPALGRCFEKSYRGKAYYEAVQAILAIEYFKLEKGSYPVGFEELVAAGYLDSVPYDPYSADSLIYRRIDDGYTLYSVGCNFIDDGGEPYKDKNGKVRLWKSDGGDAVFWPVQ